MTKALIIGVSGQDGTYLTELLFLKGYEFHGTSRDALVTSFQNLKILGIRQDVGVESFALNDFSGLLQALANIRPDEVYNLAGQSSVGLSFHCRHIERNSHRLVRNLDGSLHSH